MKKLAIIFASLALAATPVFACPHSDKAEADTKTAENDKQSKDAKDQDQAKKAAPKTDKAGDTKTAKPAEPAEPKKPANDKVSSK